MGKISTHRRTHSATRILATVGAGALVLWATRLFYDLYGPALSYSMSDTLRAPLDSLEFVRFLTLVTGGSLRRGKITRLRNGSEFYPAYLEAIRRARHAINLEFYEFHPGEVATQLLDALCERASAGARVRVMVDAIGSFGTPNSYFDRLRAAGGQMRWYNPIRPATWQRANNRSHRKLLIVDGTTGFIGGAGVGDFWLHATRSGPAWRDTVLRVEGEAAAGLLSTFSENWLETSGEILSGQSEFGFSVEGEDERSADAPAFVVSSTPHEGGTPARILFQALIRSAADSIRITTPYFLPDRSALRALEDAAGRRGVRVEILTAGPHIDHPFVRRLSRHSDRRLLQSGARIFEYQPAMIHAKLMTIDGRWTIAGSTNFDHRSFALNDEVNIATLDPELAAVIEADFAEDLQQSRPVTLATLPEPAPLGKVDGWIDEAVERES